MPERRGDSAVSVPRALTTLACEARQGRWVWAFIAAALVTTYGTWLVAAEVKMGGDVTVEFYPRLSYALEELRAGRWPLWAARTMAGTPLLANPQLGLLYPLQWPLLALLPLGQALNASAVLHVALAAVGTYVLARRWGLAPEAALVSAICYAFNGQMAVRLWAGGLSLLQAAAWLPMMLVAADVARTDERWRGLAALVAVLTLSLLVGFYQPWYLGWLATLAYLALMPGGLRGRLGRLALLAIATTLALMLAAPQLLPAAELVQWTTRATRLDWSFVTAASLPPWHMPSLLLPELFGNGAGTYWPGPWWHWHERTAYAGVLALALLPLGLRSPRPAWVWYGLGLAAVGVVLALGRYTPVYEWFYRWVPGYGSFRDPARHLLLVNLAVALLAGRGAAALLRGEGRRTTLAVLLAFVGGGAMAAVVLMTTADWVAPQSVEWLASWGLWWHRVELAGPDPRVLGELVLFSAARACGLMVLAAAIALVAVAMTRRVRAQVGGVLLATALLVDLLWFSWPYLHQPLVVAPGVAFAPPKAQFESLLGADNLARLSTEAEPQLSRVAAVGREAVVAGNAGYVLPVALAIGLDPLLPRRYAELAALINQHPVTDFDNVALSFGLMAVDSALAPLLNAPHWLQPNRREQSEAEHGYSLHTTRNALPRVFVVTDIQVVAANSALDALNEPAFDVNTTVVLEGEAGALPPRSGSQSRPSTVAQLQAYVPGDVVVHAELPEPGALVFLEAWHPGWTATVDGHPSQVFIADHAFMAVALGAGPHAIHWRFAPRSWTLGLVVSGAGVGTCGLLALAWWWWRRPGMAGTGATSD